MSTFKRSLFGYRPSDVHGALAARDAAIAQGAAALAEWDAELKLRKQRIEQLDAVCDRLCDRLIGRERALSELEAELRRHREDTDFGLQALSRLAAELDGIRRQARGQATRIRLRALRDAVELNERITELAGRPAGAGDRLLDALVEAIERLGGEDQPVEVLAAHNGPLPRRAGELFDGRIEVEIGPLDDFSQLVGFEDAAEGISATSQISIKRFAQGRATLEMELAEPVELLRELEQRAPFEFHVRDQRFDRVVLDVDGDGEIAEAA